MFGFHQQVDEEQDKLDRLHMGALMKEPEAGPYYNAKHQTHRRVMYCIIYASNNHLKVGYPTWLKSLDFCYGTVFT